MQTALIILSAFATILTGYVDSINEAREIWLKNRIPNEVANKYKEKFKRAKSEIKNLPLLILHAYSFVNALNAFVSVSAFQSLFFTKILRENSGWLPAI